MGQCSLCVFQVLYVSMFAAYLLSCLFPLSPVNGGVTVTGIHPGGQAHFHCNPGFQVRGHEVATCVNATVPRWSTPEPQCVGQYHASCGNLNVIFSDFHSVFFLIFAAVSCGGRIRNATVGRIMSPPPTSVSNNSNGSNLSCHWLIEAKEGHRLHLHFERIAFDENDDKYVCLPD